MVERTAVTIALLQNMECLTVGKKMSFQPAKPVPDYDRGAGFRIKSGMTVV